ncbi:MAG: sugar ABC transporter permease [Clostridia bacterium]|nr:sugar ABC transporter permease [Clostridia bacterium]MBQ2461867.1 sugar ABC transporter permease [Clostridia bacterium]MBQ9289406.1 sugar ABC transporter permease [Clostridia bacterium]
MQNRSAGKTVKRRGIRSLSDPKVVPYVFVAPFIVFFLFVYMYPLIMTVIMSFQQIDGPNHHQFIGLKNYQKLNTRDFQMALQTSGRYALWDVIVLTIVPLLIACILHSGLAKGSGFFKSLFFIPSLTSIIVAGIVFRLAFGTLETATMNRLMTAMGFQPVKWLSYAGPGNFVLILLTLWRWNGVNIVYYLSGLQSIPTDYYEAAQIDGASALQKFFHVTLPCIRPVLIYVITITVLGGFSMFTESVALWQQNNAGGVGRTIVGYMYMVGFKKNNLGLASAVGLTLLVLVVAVNLVQLVLMGFFRKEE